MCIYVYIYIYIYIYLKIYTSTLPADQNWLFIYFVATREENTDSMDIHWPFSVYILRIACGPHTNQRS